MSGRREQDAEAHTCPKPSGSSRYSSLEGWRCPECGRTYLWKPLDDIGPYEWVPTPPESGGRRVDRDRLEGRPQMTETPDADTLARAQSTDAMQWAEAFVAAVEQNPSIATDAGTMVSWFAVAIESGRAAGERHTARRLQRLIDINASLHDADKADIAAVLAALGDADTAQADALGGILSEIRGERGRQDAKWGEQSHEPSVWLAILTEEVGEFAEAVLHALAQPGDERNHTHSEDMRTEAIQIAAVAAQIVEYLDRAVVGDRAAAEGRPVAGWFDGQNSEGI